jgi:hypothetical protein
MSQNREGRSGVVEDRAKRDSLGLYFTLNGNTSEIPRVGLNSRTDLGSLGSLPCKP